MLNQLVFHQMLNKKNLHQLHLIHLLMEFLHLILSDLIFLLMDFGILTQHILKLKLMYHKWVVLKVDLVMVYQQDHNN